MSGAARSVYGTVATGQQSVSSPGTAEALNDGTPLRVPNNASVAVRANSDNDGTVYLGDETVDSATGGILAAGESLTLAVDNVATLYIDADTAEDGVSWIVEQEETDG